MVKMWMCCFGLAVLPSLVAAQSTPPEVPIETQPTEALSDEDLSETARAIIAVCQNHQTATEVRSTLRQLRDLSEPELAVVLPHIETLLLHDETASMRTRRSAMEGFAYSRRVAPKALMLAVLASDPAPDVRAPAATALAKWRGDADAMAALRAAVNDPSQKVVQTAWSRLLTIGEDADYAAALAAIQQPGLKPEQRSAILRGALSARTQTLPLIRLGLTDRSAAVRKDAAMLLRVGPGQTDESLHQEVRALLETTLVNEDVDDVLPSLVLAVVAWVPTDAAARHLLTLAGSEQTESVRIPALTGIAHLRAPEATACLLQAVSDSSAKVRTAVAKAMSSSESPETESALFALTADVDGAVIGEAAYALGRRRVVSAVPILVGIVLDSEHRRARDRALDALVLMRTPEAVAGFGEIALCDDPRYARRAIERLGHMYRNDDAVRLLIGLFAQVPEALHGLVAKSLTQVTRVDHGVDAGAWQAWWEAEQAPTPEPEPATPVAPERSATTPFEF